MGCFFFLRFRPQGMERAMDLTDSFTWEDLPTRDADTGQLTAAGWIPFIKKLSTRVAIVLLSCHTVLTTIRILTNHETVLIAWYPFDWTVSPYYELVNISQVSLFKQQTKVKHKCVEFCCVCNQWEACLYFHLYNSYCLDRNCLLISGCTSMAKTHFPKS
jgi:hypothetical protein